MLAQGSLHSLAGINADKITVSDILKLEQLCYQNIRDENLYDIRNDAKLRAVYTSKTYEEFK